ncbi:unnamed protein product [Arctogadus glacialis]
MPPEELHLFGDLHVDFSRSRVNVWVLYGTGLEGPGLCSFPVYRQRPLCCFPSPSPGSSLGMCQAGSLLGGSERAGGCDSECSHPSLRLHLLQGKLSPVPRRREAIWSRWAASTLTSVGDAEASTSDSQRKPPRQTARLAELELTALVEGWSHRPRCAAAAATLRRQRSGGVGRLALASAPHASGFH